MAEKTVYIIDLSDKVTGKLKGVQGEAKKTDATFAGLKSSIGGMGGMLAGAFSAAAIIGFGVEVVQTTAKFQGLRNSIKFASDTAQQGELSMTWLSNLSKTYGLPLMELTEGFKTFQGAMMKTKFTSNEVRTMFAQVSTGVTAMGLSSEDAKGTFLALGQIMGKGKVQAEELRGQIGERIPGAFAIAARAMGMSTSELDKFMADGKLLAEDFLPKFAAEMEKTFGVGALEQSDSLTSSLKRATNSWNEMALAIGSSDKKGIIGGSLSLWSSLLDGIADRFRSIQDLTKINSNSKVLDTLSNEEAHYKSQAEFMRSKGMGREEITASFSKAESLREAMTADKKARLLKEIASVEKKNKVGEDLSLIGQQLLGWDVGSGMTEKKLYQKDGKYKKLKDELEALNQTGSGSQSIVDKVISSLYMPKNVLAENTKTKKQGAGGMTLNESRNGATNITFNIDTFQKNEFSKDGSNINNSMIKSFLDQMANGLATVLNDSQIAARR